MRTIKTDYRELKDGIFQLKSMNSKGEYANINTNTGMILYYKKITNMPMNSSKMTIKQLEIEINKNNAKWLVKNYKEWMKKYPDVYNNMINRINNLEIIQ